MPNQPTNYDEVLGVPPISRWRLGLFLALLIIVLIGAVVWWLDYRNAVEVEVQIFTRDKSLDLFSEREGQIGEIWVKNGAVVKKNQPVLVFNTTASPGDLIELKSVLLSDLNTKLPAGKYGSLNVDVAEIRKLQKALSILKNNGTERQAFTMRQSADTLQQALQNIKRQIALIQTDIRIANDNYQEYQLLQETGAASRLEVNNAKAQWIHYQKELEAKMEERRQLDARLLLQNGESGRLLSGKKEKIALLEVDIMTKKNQLLHRIDLWQNKNLILAPKGGILYFNQGFREGDFIQKGEMIAKVFPEGNVTYQAEGFLRAGRSGEVQVGDAVLLRVDAYPYRKYGQLEGHVSSIGKAFLQSPDRSGIPILITLDKGLKTTHEKELTFQDGMPALGRILVK